MKRRVLTALLAVCLVLALLPFLGREREVTGEIVEVLQDSGGTVLVLETDRGRRTGVLLEENTHIWSWVNGAGEDAFDAESFKVSPPLRSGVSAVCRGLGRSVETGDGKPVTVRSASYLAVDSIRTPGALTLADGTALDRVDQSSRVCYELPEGPLLLWEDRAFGPDNVHNGRESFDDLSPRAQERVLAYYEQQGLLYDLQGELERAWAAYQAAGRPEDFRGFIVGQQIYPAGSNDRLMYFCTELTLPVEAGVVESRRLTAAFDRDTGEVIDSWDLFTCPPEEAVRTILELAEPNDPALRREMEAAFSPEMLLFGQDGLEIFFPRGSLPSQEYGCGFYVACEGPLAGILQDWALPGSPAAG